MQKGDKCESLKWTYVRSAWVYIWCYRLWRFQQYWYPYDWSQQNRPLL